MLLLTAEGPEPNQTWEHPLQMGRRYELGRSTESDLAVNWDRFVSHRHLELVASRDGISLKAVDAASNPIMFKGNACRECRVRPGEEFVLGNTLFRLATSASPRPSDSTQPIEEVTFQRNELQKVRFRDAEKRIEVLTHVPEVIWGSRTPSELYSRVAGLLLAGVRDAEAVAIVELTENGEVDVLHWERRRETAGSFQPSTRLVLDAVRSRPNTVLHVWETAQGLRPDYTASAEVDWAYCTPLPDSSPEKWGIYVAGRLDRHGSGQLRHLPGDHDLRADARFTELVAEIIGAVLRLNRLERQQAGLRQFFAPPILEALGDDLDTALLEPRECDVTVMFCDLRGFSQQAEGAQDDLIGLLDRVSRALGVMTQHILNFGGVTGDFQGDAALGFWGWPFASEQSVLDACRAALAIQSEFEQMSDQPGHPLEGFRMGIGIAHGRAVAGKIGTAEQVKVSVFGPVVNLAQRLESMTKQLRVNIVLDEATARVVRERPDPSAGLTRKLGLVQPYGMERPVWVSELLLPADQGGKLTDELLQQYEQGVQFFVDGLWDDAYRCLHGMPAGDRAQDFLTMLIAQHNRVAPPGWDGVVRLPSK